jgi:flagellar hook assembly protein FlgD
MPVEILFHLAGKDTLVNYAVNSSPQRNEFIVSAQPQSAVFDPNAWILKRVTVTNGVTLATGASGSIGFRFDQNTPNPFQTLTEFSYGLPSDGPVRLCVYDVLGREVRTLLDGREKAGAYRITWDGRDDRGKSLPGGVYLCRFESDGQSLILRAVKVR